MTNYEQSYVNDHLEYAAHDMSTSQPVPQRIMGLRWKKPSLLTPIRNMLTRSTGTAITKSMTGNKLETSPSRHLLGFGNTSLRENR